MSMAMLYGIPSVCINNSHYIHTNRGEQGEMGRRERGGWEGGERGIEREGERGIEREGERERERGELETGNKGKPTKNDFG